MSLLAEGVLELASEWVRTAQRREARGIADGSVRNLRTRADELRRLVERMEPDAVTEWIGRQMRSGAED